MSEVALEVSEPLVSLVVVDPEVPTVDVPAVDDVADDSLLPTTVPVEVSAVEVVPSPGPSQAGFRSLQPIAPTERPTRSRTRPRDTTADYHAAGREPDADADAVVTRPTFIGSISGAVRR